MVCTTSESTTGALSVPGAWPRALPGIPDSASHALEPSMNSRRVTVAFILSSSSVRLDAGVPGDLAEDHRPVRVALAQLFRRAGERHRSRLDEALAQVGACHAAHDRLVEDAHRLGAHARRAHDAAPCRHLVGDRKSTRLNSSHTVISYAVFCLKKKKT